MDPITIMAAVTAAYNGVKHAVEMGREVEDVYHQLATWAGHVDDLKNAITGAERQQQRVGLFQKITFDRSATAEAFDIYTARKKLEEMEKEIFHMFLYGELCHLGLDGYREFKQIRQEVRQQRERQVLDQLRRRQDFLGMLQWAALAVGMLIVIAAAIWGTVELVISLKAG